MAEKKVFARKATGLVREIGILTAVLIAICNVVGLGWQKRVFQSAGWTPLAETHREVREVGVRSSGAIRK